MEPAPLMRGNSSDFLDCAHYQLFHTTKKKRKVHMVMLISSSQSKMPVGQVLVEVLPPAAKQTQVAGLPGNVKFWQGKVL